MISTVHAHSSSSIRPGPFEGMVIAFIHETLTLYTYVCVWLMFCQRRTQLCGREACSGRRIQACQVGIPLPAAIGWRTSRVAAP